MELSLLYAGYTLGEQMNRLILIFIAVLGILAVFQSCKANAQTNTVTNVTPFRAKGLRSSKEIKEDRIRAYFERDVEKSGSQFKTAKDFK